LSLGRAIRQGPVLGAGVTNVHLGKEAMTDHNPMTREFRIRLGRLRDFASLVESTLVAEVERLDATVSEGAKKLVEAERGEFFEYHAEDYFELSDQLPSILRYSVLTAADTALEAYLNNTCVTFAELGDVRVGLSDLKGAGIQRARRYLKKVAQVSFPDQGAVWTTVLRLHELRNSIVHADGVVPDSKAALREWTSSFAGIAIDRHGSISLDQGFAGAAMQAYEAFADDFDVACENLGLWRSVFPPLEEG
jgi:hypothetical protein